jgi:hypothetical protein
LSKKREGIEKSVGDDIYAVEIIPKRALIALCLLAALATGCGAGEEDSGQAVLTAGALVQRFQEEPGSPLLREAGGDPAFRQLGFGLNPSQRLLERYGVFSIYVVDADRPQALTSLLSDKATGQPLEADPNGVYWERDTQSRSWIAYKRYGTNVVLVWWAESAERSADARWRRLDRVLTAVEQDSLT